MQHSNTMNHTTQMIELIKHPPKIRKTKKKVLPLTFGAMITDSDVKTNYGFVYMVKVQVNGTFKLYVGQKCFHELKNPWETYTTSSKIVKSMIAKGMNVEYTIIELCNTKTALDACERKYIIQTWKKLADLGKMYLSLNFAINRVKRDRILKGIGIDTKKMNSGIVSATKHYSNIKGVA